jgi:hypothetical protein
LARVGSFGLAFLVEMGFERLLFSAEPVCLCLCFSFGFRFCFKSSFGLSLRFFSSDLIYSVTTELLACRLSPALCGEVVCFLVGVLGVTGSFFLVSPLIRSARAICLAALPSILCRSLSLADERRSSHAVLKRLPLSLQELLELALKCLKLVKSSPEFLCVVVNAARRYIIIIAVIAAAGGATSSIIALSIIVITRIAPPILLIISIPLNRGEPPIRHIRGLVLVVPPTESVLRKIVQHFFEIGITHSRTNDLSHHFFRRLNIVIGNRIPTSSPTGRCVAYAGDGHFVGVHELK